MAATLLGWVHTMLTLLPWPLATASSIMNCGTWVVFPHPVSPDTTSTWLLEMVAKSSFLSLNEGKVSLNSRQLCRGETRVN